jgi:hypothetical protein
VVAITAALGAVGIVAFLLLDEDAQSLDVTNDITNNLIMASLSRVESNCFVTTDLDQTAAFSDVGTVDYITTPNNDDPTDLGTCAACAIALSAVARARWDIDVKAHAANSSYIIPRSSSFDDSYNQDGPCSLMCSSANVKNLTQTMKTTSDSACQADTTLDTKVGAQLDMVIDQYMENTQGAIDEFAQKLGSDSKSVVNSIGTTLESHIVSDLKNELSSEIRMIQSIKVQGTSIYLDRAAQSMTGSYKFSMSATNKVINDIKQSASYSVAQSLINVQDTIGSLLGDLTKTFKIIADLLPGATYELIFILTYAVIIGAMAMIINHRYGRTIAKNLQAIKASVTQP